jgi:cyclopropane fatty-acyl-phospholipid synthase-like methyltransferase
MISSKNSIVIFFLLLVGSAFSQHHHHHKDSSKTANEFMNQSSMEELIQRFESPERDAYQKPDKVIEYLGKIKGKKIMDIGAGTGYFSVKIAQKGANVIAADVNEQFQTYLSKRIKDNKITGIQLRKIPYNSPDLQDKEVDIVFMVNTYHHIEHRVDYFSKVKPGLKKNGYLVIIDFFKTADIPVGPPIEHKTSVDEVVSELKKAGYTKFDVRVDILPYQYIIKAK